MVDKVVTEDTYTTYPKMKIECISVAPKKFNIIKLWLRNTYDFEPIPVNQAI